MVNELVVRNELTDAMVSAGRALIETLDARGWPVTASLWFFFSDEERWKLIIASPVVVEKGPREAYQEIRDAMLEIPAQEVHINLQDILVTDPEDSRLQVMRGAMGSGSGSSQMRFTQHVLNGTFIEDALVYRLDAAA